MPAFLGGLYVRISFVKVTLAGVIALLLQSLHKILLGRERELAKMATSLVPVSSIQKLVLEGFAFDCDAGLHTLPPFSLCFLFRRVRCDVSSAS